MRDDVSAEFETRAVAAQSILLRDTVDITSFQDIIYITMLQSIQSGLVFPYSQGGLYFRANVAPAKLLAVFNQ